MWFMINTQTLLALISIFWTSNAIIVKQENSLYGPYEPNAPNIAYWELTGSAQLAQTYLRLTTDEPSKQGGIWNTYPVFQHDWELHMQFHVHGKGATLNNGEGMAIWYVKDILTPGPVFGSRDYFSGLGIFIDTTENPLDLHKHRHPYISAVVNNGSQHYEHNEDGTLHQVGGCHVPVRNLEWPTKIAVSYINNVLTVFVDVEGRDEWTQCFRSEGVYLPTNYFYGVTATTGDVYSDNHDIIFITALDMSPNKEWVDKSHVVPFAENILIHPKLDEIQKTIEQLQDFVGEQMPKVEVKVESKAEEKIEDIRAEDSSVDGDETPKASLLAKCVYIGGVLLILYIAYCMFKMYRQQRQERIQKRLF